MITKENQKVLQQTADGSYTLFIPEMDEHYHSVNGAVQESEYVFIQKGFDFRLCQGSCFPSGMRVLEFGFGTGLNALITWKHATEKSLCSIQYYTIEKYPLDTNVALKLQYGHQVWPEEEDGFSRLHDASWDKDVMLSDRFLLHKIYGDFRQVVLPEHIDLVYFDAFAPDKQQGIWEEDLFQRIYSVMNPGGVLTTYCAKGTVRRIMQKVGFIVERLPGPPGKREMLRAVKKFE